MVEPRYQQQTNLVDERYNSSTPLLQYVEGSPWTVNYYSQLIGSENELSPQQTSQSGAYQQYCFIKELEIRVTSPLDKTQDSVTKNFEVSGAATVFAKLIPNQGDMFIADSGDGRTSIFAVTSAEKLTYHKDAVYSIKYKLVDYATPERLTDLEKKIVKRTIFRKEFLHYGQSPFVLAEDFDYLITFEDSYRELLGVYLHDFFSREYQTLLVPDQDGVVYDSFLTKTILNFLAVEDHPYLARIKQPRVTGDYALETPTFWDCLLKMDKDLLPVAMQQASLMDTSYFRNIPHLSGIYYTGISKIIYPTDERTDVDSERAKLIPVTGSIYRAGERRFTSLQRTLDGPLTGFSYVADEGVLPDIVPVTQDNYYIFTQQFYRPSELGLSSNFERLVMDALSQRALDKALIARLTTRALQWCNLERFYYIPILLAILKVATRTN